MLSSLTYLVLHVNFLNFMRGLLLILDYQGLHASEVIVMDGVSIHLSCDFTAKVVCNFISAQ